MRLAIPTSSVISVVLCGLAITGCSVPSPVSPTSASASNGSSPDSSWTPPGELDLAIGESTRGTSATKQPPEAMPQPNRQVVPKRQLHNVIY